MSKKLLEKRLQRLIAKRDELKKRGLEAETADEVRSITTQVEEMNEDIAEVRELISEIETEPRQTPPEGATLVNGEVKGSFKPATTNERNENPLATMEYRKAFMLHAQKGTPIPAELRAGNAIDTGDTGAAIPFTVMNEVINTVRKRYGNLYAKVRKTNVQGGLEFPVGALQATVKWINESTVSPRQEIGKLGKVVFKYHTCEIRIAQTFLSSIVSLEAFEAEVARVIAIAYMQAIDEAIVNGTGDGIPLGITQDARVTNVIEMTDEEFSNWAAWLKVIGDIPMGYADFEMIMTKGTVYSKLRTMKDEVNRPIFYEATGGRVDDTDSYDPRAYLYGHEISMVEPTILPDFDSAQPGDVVAIIWQPEEYAINENFAFTMRRYFDEETNEWIDKALAIVDGKVLNPTGYYLIKKKAS
ncbi:MAG: phage major capsid protein [Ruminococcus sp.]|nr:phage major capsid protein [Ruminococcus sp.]